MGTAHIVRRVTAMRKLVFATLLALILILLFATKCAVPALVPVCAGARVPF